MIIVATGHRPSKLGGYEFKVFDALVHLACEYLISLPELPDHGISGMALGWDQAWAQALTEFAIPFTAAVPCDGQDSRWPMRSRTRYHYLLGKAHQIVVVCPGPYEAWKMERRNRWMVDNADAVVALWNGTSGGTANCVAYAKAQGKTPVNLWAQWCR
jgi:uncharacterized phage-like protein YoqJ